MLSGSWLMARQWPPIPATAVDVGMSGLRIGHGLDVQIDGFSVSQGK